MGDLPSACPVDRVAGCARRAGYNAGIGRRRRRVRDEQRPIQGSGPAAHRQIRSQRTPRRTVQREQPALVELGLLHGEAVIGHVFEPQRQPLGDPHSGGGNRKWFI
jgi:hypothetical protein